jgi:uncharacterized protein with GYD domain
MLFLTLLKTSPSRAGDLSAFLKRIKAVTPPSDVKVHQVYFLFGQYDGAVIFEAPNLRSAKDFIVRMTIPAVYKIEALPAIPVEEL